MTRPTKHCRICGAPFTASPADRTVHCPAHRRRSSAVANAPASKTVICRCGKTVIVDGFGARTGNVCPQCGAR